MEKFGQAAACLLYYGNKEVNGMMNKFNNKNRLVAGTRIPGAAEMRKINKMKSRKEYEAEVKKREECEKHEGANEDDDGER